MAAGKATLPRVTLLKAVVVAVLATVAAVVAVAALQEAGEARQVRLSTQQQGQTVLRAAPTLVRAAQVATTGALLPAALVVRLQVPAHLVVVAVAVVAVRAALLLFGNGA